METLQVNTLPFAQEPQARMLPFGAGTINWQGLPFVEAPALTLPVRAYDGAFALPPPIADPEAMNRLFRGLVDEYGASLYYFVLKRVRHADDAADIAQQAFVEAACSLTSFRGEAELSTWIFGIATNLARNHLSRAPQNRHHFESDDILDVCESPALQPCDVLSERQGLSLVSEAMNLLPPEMAQALRLVAVEDLSYEEAAAEMNVPVGTVRSRVSRARAAVRKHLRSVGYIDAAA